MGARAAVLPRSVWPLLGLLLVAALWLWRGAGETAGPTPLFDVEPDAIRALSVRGPYGVTVLERGPSGWRLDGDRPDRVDPDELEALLRLLTTTLRSAALDDADLRRNPAAYGLDGAGPYGLLLGTSAGERRLHVGVQNPASGLFYARFDGSDELFLVGEDLIEAIHPLPDQVRARMLWPGFRRGDPETVRLRFPGDPVWYETRRDGGGRWWLRAPADPARLGDVARAYHARHRDRRATRDGDDWLRLRDREMEGLLTYLEDARVRDFLAADLTPPADGLGVRLDNGREVLYGELETENRAQAWRDGFVHGVVLPGEIPRLYAGGLSQYLHTDLLDRALAHADSLGISRADLGAIRATGVDGRWRLLDPASTSESLDLMVGDLVHLLDHAPILGVLPDADASPLKGSEIVLEIWATGPGVPPRTVVRLGAHAETGAPAAWYPGDGRVLAIGRDPLISCRTVLSAAVR